MRRVGIILTAGAALVLALVVPTVASATEKSTTSHNAEISAQSIGLDDEITAQGKKGGKHAKHGKHDRRGKRDGYRHGRHRHGHHRHYHGGHRYYYGHPYYGGYYGHPYYGGYRGGYGCNYDYPCSGSGQTYDCTRYRGPDGQPAGDPHCRYDARCDCWYHTSDRTPEGSQAQPAPERSQPAPDQGQPAPPDQPAEPGPQGPAPDQGSEPRPY